MGDFSGRFHVSVTSGESRYGQYFKVPVSFQFTVFKKILKRSEHILV